MGTNETRQSKVEYVCGILAEAKEKDITLIRTELEARLMFKRLCSRRCACEIIQMLIDIGKAKIKIVEGEEVIYA